MMKYLFPLLALLTLVVVAPKDGLCSKNRLSLWYAEPAEDWDAALPLGNGRLGAMVFGSPVKEQFTLNEESLWAGAPLEVYPDDFQGHHSKLQRMILRGEIAEAARYGREHMTKEPTSFRSYEPLGTLWLEFGEGDEVSNYRRDLNLQTGIASVSYDRNGVSYRREAFISAVDDVMVVRLEADQPGSIAAKISLARPKDTTVTAVHNRLLMNGQIVDIEAPEAYDPNSGGSGPGGAHMKFAGRLLVRHLGGSLRSEGSTLILEGADHAEILFTAKTDYDVKQLNFDRSIDSREQAYAILNAAAQKTWHGLKAAHVADHRRMFDRVSLDLGGNEAVALPTDKRLEVVKEGNDDPALVALYFQYGRYLLMGSSRPTSQLPANLQGIWSKRMWAPWEADFHLNINLQMNYWPADQCNLSEMIEPLVDWFVPTTERAEVAARKLYDADGWLIHHATNPFGRVTPSGSTKGSQFINGVLDPLAGAWMSSTLWRHYEFNWNEAFLSETAYPALKGAAEFLLDLLIEEDGTLLIVPSTSPENAYIHPKSGASVRITKGSTYSMAITRAVFEAVIEGSTILDRDAELRNQLADALTKFPEVKIGADGTIQEWIEDYVERNPGHRHISHLIGLHPFSQITQKDTALFEAARKTIERRLSSGGGAHRLEPRLGDQFLCASV